MNETASPKIVQWFFVRWKIALKIASGIVALLLTIWSVALYFNYQREEGIRAYYHARKVTDEIKSIDAFEEIVKKYARTPAATFALIELARLAEKRGEYEKAILAYTTLRKRSRRLPLVDMIALHGLASVATLQERHEEAAHFYAEAAAASQNEVKRESQFQQGLSLLRFGKNHEARKIFEEILTNEKETTRKQKIEEQILWLESHRS